MNYNNKHYSKPPVVRNDYINEVENQYLWGKNEINGQVTHNQEKLVGYGDDKIRIVQ